MKLDSMLGLVATRHGSWRGMIQSWAGSPDDAAPWTDDEFGVRWRLLGSDTDRPAHTDDHQPRLPDLQAVRARSLRWRAEAESARDRAATPRTKAASADSHEAMVETLRDRHDETAQDHESGGGDPASISTIPNPDARSPIDGPPGSAFAREVGTAIHRVLERLDLSGEQEASCDEALQRLEAEIADLVAPDQLSEALAAARPIAESLGRSRLVTRLFALGDDLIGREVPILSASAATGSSSANPGPTVVGAIDLIYRDPTTGEVVVADYKTDHVRSDESLEDHARRYAAQGAAYTRAVQEAFRLDQEPRFELWFLRHDAVL